MNSKPTQAGTPVIICGDERFKEAVVRTGGLTTEEYVAFRGGEDCRRYLARRAKGLLFVGPHIVDVSPLNLVAAVRRDKSGHDVGGPISCNLDIILCHEEQGGSPFVSQAYAAGAQRVTAVSDLESLFKTLGMTPRSTPPAEAHEQASKRAAGKVLVFTGGSGGCGKTTLALLSAIGLSQSNQAVGLLDFDLQFGNLSFLLGLDDTHTLDDLTSCKTGSISAASIRSLMCHIAGEVGFIGTPKRPERAEAIIPRAREIISACQSLFDVTVVDAGSYFNDATVELLEKADAAMVVCDSRASGVHDCGRTMELCTKLGVPIVRLHALMNRKDPKRGVDEINAAFALKGVDLSILPDGGREVDELIGLGCPEELFALRNPLAVEISRLASECLGLSASLNGRRDAGIQDEGRGGHLPFLRRRRYA